MTHPIQQQETLLDDDGDDAAGTAHGVVSRKSSRETGVYRRGMTTGELDDEARYPRHLPPPTHSKPVSLNGADVSESLVSDSISNSRGHGRAENTSDHPSSSSDPTGSTSSSFFLTLKPAKPTRREHREEASADVSHDHGQTTTDAEDDQRLHTPAKRTEGAPSQETPRSSGRKPRDRKAQAPPPRNVQPAFTNLILPHAQVPRAPSSGMYFSKLPYQGIPPPKTLRAHTGTLVGNNLYVIGGCDKHGCWPGVAVFNTETHMWRILQTGGDVTLPPLRAHTTTLVGKTLYVVGGGDGPNYSNDVYALDTFTQCWSKPRITSALRPPPRRAHTTVHYTHYLLLFAGGNGHAALNDVWACDISDPYALSWQEWHAKGDVPVCKGYHTANLIGEKMVVYGGSDGVNSFADVHVLDIPSMVWTRVQTNIQIQRLSHTSTQVGSYLFVIGGHDGHKYAQDVLLFNLVTLEWETKPIHGDPPAARGYRKSAGPSGRSTYVAVLHDSRLLISGGYDGQTHFGDLHALELASCAYLPQVTTFEVDEKAARTITAEGAETVPDSQPPKG